MSNWHGTAVDDERASPADLAKAKSVMEEEVPIMAPPPDTQVTLFRGLEYLGKRHTTAIVRELTGADEESISRLVASSSDLGSYYNAVLCYGVESIGTLDFPSTPVGERQVLIDSLLLGDKEWLFVNVVRATYGDERTIPVVCNDCGTNLDIVYSLKEDVKVRSLVDDADEWYFTTKNGRNLTYRLLTGADQAESLRKKTATPAERNTLLLARCIVAVDGKPLVDPIQFVRDLGALDRRTLLDLIVSKQPGPYFEEVKLPCEACGAESVYRPSWADLL